MSYSFRTEQWIPVPRERVFRFFANPGNLPRLMPAWMRVELLQVKVVPPEGMEPVASTVSEVPPFAGMGSELVASYRGVPVLPFRITAVALITEFAVNEYFSDIQKEGPFRSWHHRHQFAAESRNGVEGTHMQDIVEYEIGFGLLGMMVQKWLVGPQIRRTFLYRQKALEKLLR